MNSLHNRHWLSILVMVVLMCVWPQVILADEDEQGDQEEQEKIVNVEQLPLVVRKTLQRESIEGSIGKIEKEIKDGRVFYEADVMLDGREYEVKIAANGILIKKELEEENDEEHQGRSRVRTWTFEKDRVGTVPKGWKVTETSGTGNTATWKVVTDRSAPSPGHAVAITANRNHGRTFNILMAQDTNYKDLEIEVMVKAVTGREDQGGGPIWRAKNGDNYYICRWNPLENNFRLYFVKNGRRRQLASAEVRTDTRVWHKIGIEQKGTKIEAEFDGKKLIEIEDDTFTEPGMIGLWVKADGKSKFDNIKVVNLEAEQKGKSHDEDSDRDEDEDENEQQIHPPRVPAVVLKAANRVVRGGKIKEVEKETEDGVVIYEVKKALRGEEYEIIVTSKGVVKKVEKEKDEKEDEDDDDY